MRGNEEEEFSSLPHFFMHSTKGTLVIGTGNLLLKDEGVGVHVIQRLQEKKLPPDVEVLDGGTSGFDLLYEMEGRKHVVIIDAVKGGEEPGTIYRFSGNDVKAREKAFVSLHDINLADVFRLAELLGNKPEIKVIGIEPKCIEPSLELSPEIEDKIPIVIGLVEEEIGISVDDV
jgi:hydrogenase maturation protease